jgi:retron-type reverse transcriptase
VGSAGSDQQSVQGFERDLERNLKQLHEELRTGSYRPRPIRRQYIQMRRWQPEAGTPQGAVISPLLAKLYLHPVDEAMAERGLAMIRYADDLVVLCRSQQQA